MALRENLNEGSPLVRAVVVIATVAMLCAAFFSYRAMSGSNSGRDLQAGDMTSIRCGNCEYTAERKTDELVATGQIDPLERVALLGNARTCPKCGKPTLLIEEKRAKTAK